MSPLGGGALVFAVAFAALAGARLMRRQPPRLAGPSPPVRLAPAWARWRPHAAARAAAVALPGLLDEIASGVRAGGSLHAAVRGASAGAAGLTSALRRVDRGAPLVDALDHWRRTAADPASRLAATTLVHVATFGGTDPRPIEAAADALREQAALRGEIRTQAAQARASAIVLSGLPPGFLVVVAAFDADVAEVVLRTPLGWACLTSGLALDALGLWWMARIVAGVAP